ncbi:MAG: YkvA family protein [Gammaproteobacteria bacterium]|nr:YkvA family protein [Gammaproteobacteria bacterium]
MSLRVSFELDESDLTHFRLIMREARKAVARMAPEEIVAAAEVMLQDLVTRSTPGFILERIKKLQMLIRMMTDLDWRLPHQEATRVLNALAYFTEPDDLIPDHIPGLGFLDDAIMVELVVRELKHEIEAYRDFCEFRDTQRDERNRSTRTRRDEWLAARRDELQSRMRRRRERGRQLAEGTTSLRLFD